MTEHIHEYAPQGLVREGAVQGSPYSRQDETLYDKVFSVGLCPCGDVSKKHVANENVRLRGDEERERYWRQEGSRTQRESR